MNDYTKHFHKAITCARVSIWQRARRKCLLRGRKIWKAIGRIICHIQVFKYTYSIHVLPVSPAVWWGVTLATRLRLVSSSYVMQYLTDLLPKPVGSKAETCCLIHPNLFSSTYCFQLILVSCSSSSFVCRVVLTHFCHNLTSLVTPEANRLWDPVTFVENSNWNIAVGGWQDECVKFHCSNLINTADMQGLSLHSFDFVWK